MRLDCVLTATNDNPMYMGFIPIFVKAWNKLYPDTDVKIIFIGENIPDELHAYKDNIILFPHIQGIPSASISQYVRLLYPALLDYEEGILITDMDMLPMSKTYYSEPIKDISKDGFVHWLCPGLGHDELAMCYNIARNTTWGEIFQITSIKDVTERLEFVYKKNPLPRAHSWFCDQLHLQHAIKHWGERESRLTIIPPSEDATFRRLCRSRDNPAHPETIQRIRDGYYVDYHAHRPYDQYKEVNDLVLSLLPSSEN